MQTHFIDRHQPSSRTKRVVEIFGRPPSSYLPLRERAIPGTYSGDLTPTLYRRKAPLLQIFRYLSTILCVYQNATSPLIILSQLRCQQGDIE